MGACKPVGAIDACGKPRASQIDRYHQISQLKDGPQASAGASSFKVDTVNGDGRTAPNYDYYLDPDQNQLNYQSMYSVSEILDRYGDMFSAEEAQALFNSAQHKPQDKQMQFFGTLDYMVANGIDSLSKAEFKEQLVSRGYNPNDPYQNTEIEAWSKWSIVGGDVYL